MAKEKLIKDFKAELGRKYDEGKRKWSMMLWPELSEVMKVLEFGADKYAPNNWKFVEGKIGRYVDATFRHLIAWVSGEENDSETGYSHLAHMACNILFLMWIEENVGYDIIQEQLKSLDHIINENENKVKGNKK